MFWRLVERALWVRRSRVVMALLSITVGASVVTALSALYLDLNAKLRHDLRSEGPNVFIAPNPEQEERLLGVELLNRYLEAAGDEAPVSGVAVLYGVVRLDQGNAVLLGADLPALRKLSPYWQVQGEWLLAGFDDRHCLVGVELAESMDLKVGDTVTIQYRQTDTYRQLTVRGVFESGEAADNQILVNLSVAQRILGLEGQAHLFQIAHRAPVDAVEAATRAFQSEHPEIDVRLLRRLAHGEGVVLKRIQILMGIISIVILIASTIGVATTLFAIVYERREELGLLKALGADSHHVVVQFLTEAAVLGVLGSVLGLVLGAGLAQLLGTIIFQTSIDMPLSVPPLTLLSSIVCVLIAAIVPVRMALDIQPAVVLRGE